MTPVLKSRISMGYFSLSILIQFCLFYSFSGSSWGTGGSNYQIWEVCIWILNPIAGLAWLGLTSSTYGFAVYALLALLASILGTFILSIIVEVIDAKINKAS